MKSLTEYNGEIAQRYTEAERNKYKSGIECPDCKGIELLKTNPGVYLSSMPPKMKLQCPNCKKIHYALA